LLYLIYIYFVIYYYIFILLLCLCHICTFSILTIFTIFLLYLKIFLKYIAKWIPYHSRLHRFPMRRVCFSCKFVAKDDDASPISDIAVAKRWEHLPVCLPSRKRDPPANNSDKIHIGTYYYLPDTWLYTTLASHDCESPLSN